MITQIKLIHIKRLKLNKFMDKNNIFIIFLINLQFIINHWMKKEDL